MFKQLILLITFGMFMSGCGIGIGNSDVANAPNSNSIIDPAQRYDDAIVDTDCGSYNEINTENEIEVGRQCIRDAFDSCLSAKYLVDQVNDDNERFASFVQVFEQNGQCQLFVSALSEQNSNTFDLNSQTCDTLNLDEVPELACGVDQ